MEFTPKKVICILKGDSFKYTCKNIHLDSSGHEVCNTYRFNRGVAYLVKNQEDYDELVSLNDMFEAYDPEEKEIKEVVETKKEKKARLKAEKEADEKEVVESGDVEDTGLPEETKEILETKTPEVE